MRPVAILVAVIVAGCGEKLRTEGTWDCGIATLTLSNGSLLVAQGSKTWHGSYMESEGRIGRHVALSVKETADGIPFTPDKVLRVIHRLEAGIFDGPNAQDARYVCQRKAER